tara:strand:+ start:254 stop:874 length:621 start_codon:yes stop_codon:yes gene_type:complete
MTKTNAKTATLSADNVIRIGNVEYTAKSSLEHGAAVYDQMYLLQTSMLDCFNELGQILIQHRAMYKSDKLFGQMLATSPLAGISRQDRSDTVFVASNWAKIQKLNENGSLDSLGVSAIRKRIKALDKPKTPKSAGNVSKGKAKPEAEATDGPSDTKTEANDLSKLMKDPKAFGKLIADLVNKNYTDTQIQAFAHEMAKNVIIDLRQ